MMLEDFPKRIFKIKVTKDKPPRYLVYTPMHPLLTRWAMWTHDKRKAHGVARRLERKARRLIKSGKHCPIVRYEGT
jgi:hypothetical protein